jgi:hypothetical protein
MVRGPTRFGVTHTRPCTRHRSNPATTAAACLPPSVSRHTTPHLRTGTWMVRHSHRMLDEPNLSMRMIRMLYARLKRMSAAAPGACEQGGGQQAQNDDERCVNARARFEPAMPPGLHLMCCYYYRHYHYHYRHSHTETNSGARPQLSDACELKPPKHRRPSHRLVPAGTGYTKKIKGRRSAWDARTAAISSALHASGGAPVHCATRATLPLSAAAHRCP